MLPVDSNKFRLAKDRREYETNNTNSNESWATSKPGILKSIRMWGHCKAYRNRSEERTSCTAGKDRCMLELAVNGTKSRQRERG